MRCNKGINRETTISYDLIRIEPFHSAGFPKMESLLTNLSNTLNLAELFDNRDQFGMYILKLESVCMIGLN